jgi:hypothetical protein
LLAKQSGLQFREIDPVRATVLCEGRGNVERARLEVKELVRHLEPNLLPRTDHPSKEDEPPGVLREPRRELVKLLDAERPSFARPRFDRWNAQDCLVNSLAAAARVA